MPPTHDPELEARALALMADVVLLGEPERSAALDAACARDEALRQRVVQLLAQDTDDEAADAFAEGSPWIGAELLAGDEPHLPERIGGFRILRRLGQGGMGVVYEGEQTNPRRRVAIKVVSSHVATGDRARRFEREKEALARLQHPGIATMLEAGTALTPAGERPWFAMELVDGVPINAHAARARLDTAQRLELLAELADAVQHAHEHGVVHRDLKPDNVLVDRQGRVKVLDFGVARVSEPSTVLQTLVTETGALVGTLAYMAPEQVDVDRQEIGPHTDVYALGVIAYELLTGRRPHELAGLPLQAAARLIAERDAPRLGQLDAGLRGDVETVVGKALEKEVGRRYASAAVFAADLRRIVGHEPVSARPPTMGYRLRRFSRRHRGLVVSVVGLLLVTVAAVLLAVEARRQADRAERSSAARDRQAYRATLLLTSQQTDLGGEALAALLDDAPASLRGWEWRHLRARAEPRHDQLSATGYGHIDRLHMSHSGRRALDVRYAGATFEPKPALLWDLDTGEHELIGHEGVHISDAAFRPGDREVAAVGFHVVTTRHWVGVYDLVEERWTESYELGDPSPTPYDDRDYNEVDGSGRLALLCTNDEPLLLHEIGTTQLRTFDPDVHLPTAFLRGVDAFIFNRDRILSLTTGRELAAGSTPTVIHGAPGFILQDSARETTGVYSIDPRSERVDHRLDLANLITLTAQPDWSRLVTLERDRHLRVRDGRSGEALLDLGSFADQGHRQVSLAADGHTLVALGAPEQVAVWPRVFADPTRLEGHESFVYGVDVSADGGLVASGSWDDSVRLHDGHSGAEVAIWRTADDVFQTEFHPAEPLLAVGIRDGGVQLIDLAVGALRATHGRTAWNLAYSPDGERLAVAGTGTLSVLGGRDLADQASLSHCLIADCFLCRHDMAWDDDGQSLAVLHSRRYHIPGSGPTGQRLLAHADQGFQPRVLRRYDPRDLAILEDLPLETLEIWCLTALPAGAGWLVGGTGSRLLRPDGTSTPLPESGATLAAAVSPDGARLVTGGYDDTLHVWDAATGDELARLSGHDDYIKELAWSPDGETLYSASGDGSVGVWSSEPLRERNWALDRWHQVADRLRPEIERRFAGDLAAGTVYDLPIAERVADLGDTARERQIAGQLLLGLRLEHANDG